MEGMTGIEPASHAWKARILAIVLHPHILLYLYSTILLSVWQTLP